MTDERIAPREVLEKGSDATFSCEMIGFAAQRLMELETEAVCGTDHGERSAGRANRRNGSAIATGRPGPEPSSRASRSCAVAATSRLSPIEGEWPHLWLDATYVKVREAGRVISVAVTIATGVNNDGRREVLGMAVGASEAETFWTDFLRTLAQRGLRGVKLVVSDAHEGLKTALARGLHASWQRCRVRSMRTRWPTPARAIGASSQPGSAPPSPRPTRMPRASSDATPLTSCVPGCPGWPR